jgi:DNA polymerase-3 subunit beta
MKLTIERSVISAAMTLVDSVVPARSPRPQLMAVKGVAKDKTLTLSATDAESSIKLAVRCDVQEPGEFLVDAGILRSVISQQTDDTLVLETESDAVVVRVSDARFKLFAFPPSEAVPFPEPAKDERRADVKIPVPVMRKALKCTMFATARENSRYAINGILMRFVNKRLDIVATDGRRLSVFHAKLEEPPEGVSSATLPTKAMSLLERLLADGDDYRVRIALSLRGAWFAVQNPAFEACTLYTNLVEGTFPPYEEVLPKDSDKRVTVDREKFTSAVKRAALLMNKEVRGVRFDFSPSLNLSISSKDADEGYADISLTAEKYEGESLAIGFNPNYILDVLRVIDGPAVLNLSKNNKPGMITVGDEFRYVVMPMSIDHMR